MILVSKNVFRWRERDWLDQPLHVAMGAAPFLLLVLLSDYKVWAALAIAAIATGYYSYREWRQHPGVIINLDFIFIITGEVYATFIMLT